MALSTKSPMPTLQQDKGSNAANNLRATVTGVNSGGQLFRDSASVVYLKDRKCIYQSKFNPSLDTSVMIELPPGQGGGKETWRSNAKVKGVSPVGPKQDTFRVTVELEQGHSVVIDSSESEEPLRDSDVADSQEGFSNPAVVAPPASRADRDTGASPANDTKKSDRDSAPAAVPELPMTLHDGVPIPSGGISPGNPAKPSQASMPAPKVMVTDIVRSVMASEFGQFRRELQSSMANQVETALQQRLQTLETKLEQQGRARPALTEEAVRKLAAQAAENAQNEWIAAKLRPMLAEAVRSALASDNENRRRELADAVSSAVEAAVRGPIAARIEAALEQSLQTRMEKYFRTRPEITEETVRRLAARVAEDAQLEWATTKLQKTLAEAMRQPLEAERALREQQLHSVVSSEIEAAVEGPVAARMEAMLKKTLQAQWAEHARKPPPITEETIRQIAASVAEHPQLQGSIDALAAKLTERWAEVARGASTGAQQDLRSRMAASEHLANQVVTDIQEKLNSFGVEMDRLFGRQQADSNASPRGQTQEPDLQDREKRFREVLQSAGSQFEREMKAALQKIFGKM